MGAIALNPVIADDDRKSLNELSYVIKNVNRPYKLVSIFHLIKTKINSLHEKIRQNHGVSDG